MTPVAILICLTTIFVAFQQTSPRLAGYPLAFLGLNICFLMLIMPAPAWGWLFAYLAANYVMAMAARRAPAIPAAAFVIPAVILFCLLKKYEFISPAALSQHIPEIIGLSYMIFRALMIIFEARDTGRLPGPVSYINFCLNLFTLISGPVQRYRAFAEDMERRKNFRLGEKEGASALTRFINGALKVVYLSPMAQDAQNYCMLAQQKSVNVIRRGSLIVTLGGPFDSLGDLAPSFGLGFACLFYLVFLYFNFSGYTDMMIGMGHCLGFQLPENFNNPFGATSFLEFWKRWHMSLSFWFRDYCFTPILKRMVKMGIKNPAIATLPAYFISFGLLGLWHGRTWPFILCGLMLAVGSVVSHSYRHFLTGHMSRNALTRLDGLPFYQAASGALTLFYIAVSVTGLWLSNEQFYKIWNSLAARQCAVSFALVIVCLTAILYVGRKFGQAPILQSKIADPVRRFSTGETHFLIALKIFLVAIWYFVLSANFPDFVYGHF